MLIILLLRNPHLMKRPQTRQDTAADPTAELPLHHAPRREYPDPRSRIHGLQFLLQPLIEPMDQRRASHDDDIAQQMRADIHIDLR